MQMFRDATGDPLMCVRVGGGGGGQEAPNRLYCDLWDPVPNMTERYRNLYLICLSRWTGGRAEGDCMNYRKRESARVEAYEGKGPRSPAHLPAAGPDSTVNGTEPKGWASQALAAASLLFWGHTQTVTQESAWRNKQQSRKPARPSADDPIKKETPFCKGILRWHCLFKCAQTDMIQCSALPFMSALIFL